LNVRTPVYDWDWLKGWVSLHIQEYPLPEHERARLLRETYTRCTVAEHEGRWILVPSTLQSPIPVTEEEAKAFERLPSYWRDYVRQVPEPPDPLGRKG
jgi:hypothetical protein